MQAGELEGGGWSVSAASNDEKQLVLRRYLSANESQVRLMDVGNGQTRQLLPAPEAKRADRRLSRRPLQPGWTQALDW